MIKRKMKAQNIKRELQKATKLSSTNKRAARQLLKIVKSTAKLTKETNAKNHFGAFFLPINIATKSIYLGHHIKANLWIPPGGHIKIDETPVETVKREFHEELGRKLKNEKIQLFDVSITDVRGNAKQPCEFHYDFWYLVFVKKYNFKFLQKEFYAARWFQFDKAIKKIKHKYYLQTITKLAKIFRL